MELIGRRFGHILVTEVVGQGGMGEVYGGYDETLERKVALKVLNADQRLDAEARERLLREARALSKLEHPNICRIYDYIDTGDVDLLVLEYIDGRTLSDTQSDEPPRAEKLRIAIAIAEVLITAHRAGILHRDLKPENVMLTKTGQVKVLDFGLARWLQRGRTKSSGRHAAQQQAAPPVAAAARSDATVAMESVSGPVPISRPEFLNTAIGITVGTPLYMSPEQARGETLTSASDMFSYGLLLQWLFTGKDPHPADATSREAILRVARGETLPVESVPGDVTALINRLKQFAPADRPTAVETVERLRFLAEKPQRMARRGIAAAVALVLLIGAWRYVVDMRAERAIAVAARAEAVRRRGQADDLIEFMLGDLRAKLDPVGRLDILDDVGKRAIAYVESNKPETMSAEELAQSSKALNQLGEVRIGQGKLNEALEVFGRSLHFAQLAAAKDPKSGPSRLAVATAHFWVGDVYRQDGRLDDALRHYTIYMRTAELLAREYPNNADYQLERGYGYSVVAAIYERQGEYAHALDLLRETLDVKTARVAAKPADIDRQVDVARTLNRIGYVLECSGDLNGAREHYEKEFATYSRLSRLDPKNSRWKERIATNQNFLARVLEMTGDIDAAIIHRQVEVRLGRELSERDPANAKWQRNFAIAQLNYGNALRLMGDTETAGRMIEDAQRTLAGLLTRKETVWSWKRDLAVVHRSAALVHLDRGNHSAALRAATESVQELESITESDTETLRHLAESYLVLGDVRSAMGDRSGGLEAWRQAAATLSSLTAETRTPPGLDVLARTLVRLGRTSEAARPIDKLMKMGYRAPDFVGAIAEKKGGST